MTLSQAPARGTEETTEADLTALASSRICHDLISPIGAIGNGVELLTMAGGNISPELALIGDSVAAAAAKLRYFRIAFGAAAGGPAIQLSELRAACDAMFQGRAVVTLSSAAPELPRWHAKALLLALLCQERALPLGGSTEAGLPPGAVRLVTKASKIRDLGPLWALAGARSEPPADIAPADVQFPLLGQFLKEHGASFRREAGDGRLMLEIGGLTP